MTPTGNLRVVPVRAKAERGDASGCGHDAAIAATTGSALTAATIPARKRSFASSTRIVSVVLRPTSAAAAAKELRRKTAAQISSTAEAPTCRMISALRVRPGRESLITSPRMVSTSSSRVATSAGASPKNTVETMAPASGNITTRQSTAGIESRVSRVVAAR